MNKEINPAVMIGVIAVVLVIVAAVAIHTFKGGSSDAKHPGDGTFVPRHFQHSGTASVPGKG